MCQVYEKGRFHLFCLTAVLQLCAAYVRVSEHILLLLTRLNTCCVGSDSRRVSTNWTSDTS